MRDFAVNKCCTNSQALTNASYCIALFVFGVPWKASIVTYSHSRRWRQTPSHFEPIMQSQIDVIDAPYICSFCQLSIIFHTWFLLISFNYCLCMSTFTSAVIFRTLTKCKIRYSCPGERELNAPVRFCVH